MRTSHRHSKLKSNARAGTRIFVSIFAVATLSAVSSSSPNIFVKLVAISLSGFVIAGFFSVIHFASHQTLFVNRLANATVGRLFSVFLGMNFSAYKYFHYQHHRYTASKGDSEPAGEFSGFLHYAICVLNWDYICAFQRIGILSLFKRVPFFITTKKQVRQIQMDTLLTLFWCVLIVPLTIACPKLMMLGYFAPLQIGLTINFFLVIGEHHGLDITKNPNVDTRTFNDLGKTFGFFHYHSNYHAAHHANPSLPPWELPEFHAKMPECSELAELSYHAVNFEIIEDIWRRRTASPNPTPIGREKNFFYDLRKI